MKCLIKRCPNELEVCCQYCEARHDCKSRCRIRTSCIYTMPRLDEDIHSEIEKRAEKRRKRAEERRRIKACLLILSVVLAVWICGTTYALSEIQTMQTDTLNTLNDTRLEIDDLKQVNSEVEEVYQSDEKNGTQATDEPMGTYLGEFTITYYCSCKSCCGKTDGITKLGTQAEAGRTVGTDWNVIAPASKIYIEGIGERYVEDTGSGIQGNHIDVFVNSHSEALKLGRTERKVYEVK